MGEVRFFRAVQGGRDWVFAYLDGPDAVWGMDRLSGEEWWYEPSVTSWLAPMIRSRLASGVPIPEVGAPDASTTSIPSIAQRYDVALHEPGHAVLASFHALLVATGGAPPRPGMPDDLTRLARAYVGELEVSSALDLVGSRWRVLHSVPGGPAGTGVDHVAIGPGGIFTIMSRNHRGATVNVAGDTVVAAGRPETWVPESRAAAQRAQEALSASPELATSVFPTIVVVGARLSVSQAPDYVSLVDSGSLVDWLGTMPPRLSQAQVVQAYDVLRWSDAWTTAAPLPGVPDTTRALALERGLGLRAVPTTPPVPGPPPVAPASIAPAPVGGALAPSPVVVPDPAAAVEAEVDTAPEPAARRRRLRARTGPSGAGRSGPESAPRRGSRARTVAAVVASLMLVLLVAPSIITGVQRSMSEPSASATQTPDALSPLEPEIGGPCAAPDEIKAVSGERLACNIATGTWALRGPTGVLGASCPRVDLPGWSTTKNRPLVCAKVDGSLVWKFRRG